MLHQGVLNLNRGCGKTQGELMRFSQVRKLRLDMLNHQGH